MADDLSRSRAARCVRALLHLLARGEATTAEIARHTGGAVRQTRADLQLLHQLAPIAPEGERDQRVWRVQPGAPVRGLALFDRISLELGREMAAFLRGTALAEGVHDFAPLDGLPQRFSRHIDRKFRIRAEPARSYADCTETLDVVLDALLRERSLDLDYRTLGGDRTFAGLRPLSLVLYRRALYLLGRTPDREGVLRLPVERITAARVGEPFVYPRGWDPDAELRPWFGIVSAESPDEVVLRFSTAKAVLVRARTWHPSQRIVALPDGRVELRMRVGGRELVRFCLEWGEHCEVVRPLWLRTAVVRELRGALAQYLPEG